MSNFWNTFVIYLKKIGLFFKNYGLLILLGLGLLYTLLLAKRKQDAYNDLLKNMQDTLQRHKEEVAALDKIHQEELKKHSEIEKKYNETLAKIREEHEQALEQLNRQKKTELRKIIEETNDDPDVMAQRVNQLFGITVYSPPKQ